MSQHIDLGKQGEELAAVYLTTNGFTLLQRNWRMSHYEVDIIAVKNGIVHFVEVKTRSSKSFGMPEQSVTKKKLGDLLKAADLFLLRNRCYSDFRIDVLSITTRDNHPPEYFLLEDVYL